MLFTAEFFAANRTRLKSLFTGTAPIILTANGLLQRNGDTAFPFRQDSSFWYLTGITEPDILLVMDKYKEYLIVPGRTASREAFDGSIDIDATKKLSGITDIYDEKQGWKLLSGRLKRVQHAATLAAAPSYVKAHGMYVNPARRALAKRLHAENQSLDLLDLRQHLTTMRMVKQAAEIEALRQAVDATTKSFTKAKKQLDKFKHEYELESVFSSEFRRMGLQHAYPPITAAGKNAVTLHYMANNAPIDPKDLVLIDIGADAHGYAADITRTYAVSSPSKRQQQVWGAVAEVQDYAFSLLKPGVTLGENEKKIETFMGEKLREIGLIRTITREKVRAYYPHATSHFLGLDVHDAADYERPLEPGMVLTVEPGIYIPEEGIGIRIEDNVLITDKGHEILSKNLPREL